MICAQLHLITSCKYLFTISKVPLALGTRTERIFTVLLGYMIIMASINFGDKCHLSFQALDTGAQSEVMEQDILETAKS
jgi:hypothetical protein